ncbi:diacylglycerol kinase family protein [Citricoccus sp.]|uniref:diacylglycerol/lipid kinase family protein n=1 Tax=Citricoccus sp. TaxID=1978372 RepID=UPI0028BE2C39|nr:diacylglycerol kinase family protein [Citricoccus sp.]
MSRHHVLLCINPAAGAGRGADAGAEAAARLRSGGVDVEILAVPGDDGTPPVRRYSEALAARLARTAGATPAAVVVVGGDGMLHTTANVLAGTGMPVGLVPAGTGNDLARALDLAGCGVAGAADRVLTGLDRPPRRIDLARVELAPLPAALPAGLDFAGTVDDRDAAGGPPELVRRYAVSGVNVAFDAEVNATANRMRWPRGGLRYVAAVLVELLRFQPVELRIRLDGPDGPILTGPTFLLAVMNGRFIGGGMEVAPGTRIDDGVLEVFHVTPLSPVRFLRVFPKVFAGRHTHLPEVEIREAGSVRIEQITAVPDPGPPGQPSRRSAGPVLHGDGEPLGLLPAAVTVEPGALTVLDTGLPHVLSEGEE